jgi:hypothetical protein
MPFVKMHTTHASPTHILHEGKVYKVDDETADALTAPHSGPNGKPAATKVSGGKAVKPTKPDPGEKDKDETEDTNDE